ncbi:MAG: AAA family ATPase, partial [Dermatophilaceae bacterium]
MAATMRVDLLGGVEVSGADPAQVHSSARAVSLLAYLVSHPDSPQPRVHLAGVLWPDSESAQARTNLRRELHHLRVLLHDNECLQVDAQSLCWRRGPGCVVDVHDFLAACESTITAVESGEHDEVELHSGDALRLYRGPFLPGCYDDWALAVREDLSRTGVDLCDRVARYWLLHDDAEAAIGFARRRVQLQPLEEPGYRLLMQALRTVGDRAGAMRTYHQCATLLERELGVGPSAETQAELDAALSDIGHGPGGAAGIVAESGGEEGSGVGNGTARWSVSPGLVGRARERERLLSAWGEAQAGARFVVVEGEAGVGKTRLVADLVGAVRRQDALVATTRCFAASGSVPLAPVADWLRSPHLRMATKQLDPIWRAEVGRLVPQADSAAEPVVGARAKVDAWQRLRFFEGLARAFRAVDRPILLTVDDLQWCDKTTMSWLSFVMSFMGSSPLLVVATARDDERGDGRADGDLTRRLDTMRAAGQAVVVTLDG